MKNRKEKNRKKKYPRVKHKLHQTHNQLMNVRDGDGVKSEGRPAFSRQGRTPPPKARLTRPITSPLLVQSSIHHTRHGRIMVRAELSQTLFPSKTRRTKPACVKKVLLSRGRRERRPGPHSSSSSSSRGHHRPHQHPLHSPTWRARRTKRYHSTGASRDS